MSKGNRNRGIKQKGAKIISKARARSFLIKKYIATDNRKVNNSKISDQTSEYIKLEEKDMKTLSEFELIKLLNKKIDRMSLNMEKMKFVDYVYYIEHPKKMLWANFLNGIARGFGIAIGFTVLGAIAIYILNIIVQINLPVIGEFISEIVKIVQNSTRSIR